MRELAPGVRLIGGMALLIVALLLVGRLIPLDNVVSVPGGICVTDVGVCLAL